jgi:anti-sigma-K factor RskA
VERGAQLREYGQPAPDHTPDAESLAGLYAFGILEGAELARFERHLADCGRCAEVVDGDQAIVSTVSLTAPEAEPSPGFKEGLLARAALEIAARTDQGSGGVGGEGARSGPVPFRPRRNPPVPLVWLLPLAAVILALFVGAGLLSRQISSAQIVAAATLENRSDRGRAEVLVRRSGEGVIQLTGFEDLKDGQVYQAWVIRPGSQPVATGLSTSGNSMLTLEGDVRGAKVAVTLEPRPGATVPSVRPFVIGDAPA